MPELSALELHIREIGHQMVSCDRNCVGAALDRARGVIPRGLILETDGRGEGTGCVILGINPGRSSERARSFQLSTGLTYDSVLRDWREYNQKWKYYPKLRKLADGFGLRGPILWTEVVKCENQVGTKVPPVTTFQTCTGAYLTTELSLVPSDWPIIAVGRSAFGIASDLYSERIVLGVPHPTGSFGHFAKLFDAGQLREEFGLDFDTLFDSNKRSIWAGVRKARLGWVHTRNKVARPLNR